MKELTILQEGLMNSNALVIKNIKGGLECIFLREGFVKQTVVVRDKILSSALTHLGINGILEGVDFHVFRSTFDAFSLRVKARKLYQELSSSTPTSNYVNHTATSAA